MSFANVIAGLEDFVEEVNSGITATQPTDDAFEGETAGVDFNTDSTNIDEDVEQISTAAKGLEDIISLVEDAPGEADKPLEPFVKKAVNVALESNDLIVAAGNPASDEKTKGGVLDKIKGFAAKVWEMLRNFGKKIAAWVRETWAKFTDRIVKNANAAQKIIAQCSSLADRDGAKIEDKGLLAKVATFKNGEIGEALINVSNHANVQGSKASDKLTKEARECIDLVAGGASTADGMMDRFLAALTEGAGSYEEEASAQQAQVIKAAAGTKTLLSGPFFGGYRAWVTTPDNAEALQHWNHGITKVDEVKPQESIAAPSGTEIAAIAKYIVELGQLVKIYQSNIKNLDILNKELDKAASKARNAKSESAQLKQMQAVIPRIIKGPQVAAYAYATSASTACLQFCQAAIAAHQQKPAEAKPAAAEAK
jgi:hypothetical protein